MGSRGAWVDESVRTGNVPMYLLGATAMYQADREAVLDAMALLAPVGKKLHWRDLGDKGKADVMDRIASHSLHHVVVVGVPLTGIRQERARGLCFERLMWELDQMSVSSVVFESRSGSQDRQDQRRVDGLRSRGIIGPEIRAEWRAGLTDPRLWVADAIVGAVGDARASGAILDRRLADCIIQIDVDL